MSLLSGQADVYPSYLNMYMLEACTEQLLAAALCYKGMLKQGESCAHKIQAEMTLWALQKLLLQLKKAKESGQNKFKQSKLNSLQCSVLG